MPDRARVELHWLGEDGLLGNAVSIPLAERRFSENVWKGQSPETAVAVEIRLVQARLGGLLTIDRISLNRIDMHSIPLIFLSEAPGELSVSNIQVVYDLPSNTGLTFPQIVNGVSSTNRWVVERASMLNEIEGANERLERREITSASRESLLGNGDLSANRDLHYENSSVASPRRRMRSIWRRLLGDRGNVAKIF